MVNQECSNSYWLKVIASIASHILNKMNSECEALAVRTDNKNNSCPRDAISDNEVTH